MYIRNDFLTHLKFDPELVVRFRMNRKMCLFINRSMRTEPDPVTKPVEHKGPKEGYVNSHTGKLMKPKESENVLIEIFQKSYESFTIKFKNCTNQKTELYNILFDKYC